MAHPCSGSNARIFRISRLSVPRTRSGGSLLSVTKGRIQQLPSDIKRNIATPSEPKRQLLAWVVEGLAAGPGGEVVQRHFHEHIKSPNDPAEFESLIESERRFKNADISTTLLEGWAREVCADDAGVGSRALERRHPGIDGSRILPKW
jgi:hypothetical protein